MFKARVSHRCHFWINFEADVSALGPCRRFSGRPRTSKHIPNESARWTARSDQDFKETIWLFCPVDCATVHRAHVDDGAHYSRTAIFALIWRLVDATHMSWATLLALDDPGDCVMRFLYIIVDTGPWSISSVKLDGMFMNALEAISVESGAVVFFPYNVLGIAQSGPPASLARCRGRIAWIRTPIATRLALGAPRRRSPSPLHADPMAVMCRHRADPQAAYRTGRAERRLLDSRRSLLGYSCCPPDLTASAGLAMVPPFEVGGWVKAMN